MAAPAVLVSAATASGTIGPVIDRKTSPIATGSGGSSGGSGGVMSPAPASGVQSIGSISSPPPLHPPSHVTSPAPHAQHSVAHGLADALSVLERNTTEVAATFQQFLLSTASTVKEVSGSSVEHMNVMQQATTVCFDWLDDWMDGGRWREMEGGGSDRDQNESAHVMYCCV